MATTLIGKKSGDLRPQKNQGDCATTCLPLRLKLQQHQLHAASSEHLQQSVYSRIFSYYLFYE
uniref:Uncharacterized protein n=1 Tax=Solanum lycopersicum TaxID=4081 RepID=K4BQT1_SOLLC